jgi:hypothetical protein
MKNVEIVKQVLEGDAFWFGGSCKVSEYANESQVQIVTKAVFVRYTMLNDFIDHIEDKGGKICDAWVSPMPSMDNRLSITIVFNV